MAVGVASAYFDPTWHHGDDDAAARGAVAVSGFIAAGVDLNKMLQHAFDTVDRSSSISLRVFVV